MKYQSAYFILSMSVFFAAHMVIFIKNMTDTYAILLILLSSSIFTDLMPMGYVIYCHRRSFRRVQIFYEDMRKHTLAGTNDVEQRETEHLLLSYAQLQSQTNKEGELSIAST